MAQKSVSIIQPKYWGAQTHEQCVFACDPYDAYLNLYMMQYRRSLRRNTTILDILQVDGGEFGDDDIKKDKDGNLIYPQHIDFRLRTMNIMNSTINDILFDDTLWPKHFRYKHKNKQYLEKSMHESFRSWYLNTLHNNTHQIPQRKQRNKIVLVPITDDVSYFIDHSLIKQLKQLIYIYFGLECKDIDVSNTNNVMFRKDENGNMFITKEIHHKLSTYYHNDRDIFALIGVCSKVGILNYGDNKVIHGEHNDATQSAVCSFAKLGVYNKLDRNVPDWLKIRRCGKILLHEIAHLLGMQHCEFFRCLMNKDVVLDCVPMTLCPVCLNKLYFAMVYDHPHRNSFEYDIPLKQTEQELQREREKEQLEKEAEKEKKQKMDQDALHVIGIESGNKPKSVARCGGTEEQRADRKRKRKKKTKIDSNTFNLLERYRALAAWCQENKLYREATWYKNRLKSLNAIKAVNVNGLNAANLDTGIMTI